MKKTVVEKPKIQIPPKFLAILAEVVDPHLSTEYQTVAQYTFPIEILTVSVEEKLRRLVIDKKDDYDRLLMYSVAEIGCYYDQSLRLRWSESATREESEEFYLAHIEKLKLNDIVIDVVGQMIKIIDWKPVDKKKVQEYKRYAVAEPLQDQLLWFHLSDKLTPHDLRNNYTRGMIELIKFSNMVTNDKMKSEKEEPDDPHTDRMGAAQTMEDYLAGLEAQGVNPANLF